MFMLRWYIFLIPAVCSANTEMTGILAVLHSLGLIKRSPESLYHYSEVTVTRGKCPYSFERIVLRRSLAQCEKNELEEQLASLSTVKTGPPLMVKCLQMQTANNATKYDNTLHILNSIQEIFEFLRPIGNATKRHEPGNCALVLFCTPTSLACAELAPTANMMPYLFPTLRFGYIDPLKFPVLNAEFGVPSVPTFMIFHQGRPFVRQYDANINAHFITHFTGIEPIKPVLNKAAYEEPLSAKLEIEPNYLLGLSWLFIFLCAADFISRTAFWTKSMDIIKRNWRDFEETQMEIID